MGFEAIEVDAATYINASAGQPEEVANLAPALAVVRGNLEALQNEVASGWDSLLTRGGDLRILLAAWSEALTRQASALGTEQSTATTAYTDALSSTASLEDEETQLMGQRNSTDEMCNKE